MHTKVSGVRLPKQVASDSGISHPCTHALLQLSKRRSAHCFVTEDLDKLYKTLNNPKI